MTTTRHRPVLVETVVRMLGVRSDEVYLDATLGGGGYAEAVLEAGAGKVIGLDWDEEAVKRAGRRLAAYGERFEPVRAGFQEAVEVLGRLGLTKVGGVMADLGLSSDQLAAAERGFSFSLDGPLDMRMDRRRRVTAADIIAGSGERELKELFSRLGEERQAGRVAKAIVVERAKAPITTTARLAEIVARAKGRPRSGRRTRIHPATQVFQALRLAVNGELDNLTAFLQTLPEVLASRGRAVVVSYHSLEDRLVKEAFRTGAKGCVCPPEKPCVCGREPVYRVLTRKPIAPSAEEVAANPRARSAKLRAVERL